QASEQATGNEDIPLLSTVDLEELVGPIALYPDDLLAIVLPASAYPLQIVDAARFLESLEDDDSLKPDPEWDESVVALLNYPEVIELLNEDIDWTWRLGEAVVSQQADVVAAIETFRDRAYAAGNLKSDSYQNVSRDEGIIEITPIAEDVIYVPYYEPERVVVYQPRPVYYYYPRAYPVYYYPYSSGHAFDRGYFWGVTTAFTIGWFSDSLHVFHHSYHGHPYYGHSYWDRWWYRRPSISIHNTTYVGSNTNVTVNRYYGGDRWRPRVNRRDYVSEGRVTRNREYPRRRTDVAPNRVQRVDSQRQVVRRNTVRRELSRERTREQTPREPVAFRERPQTVAVDRREPVASRDRTNSRRAIRPERTDRREPTARVTTRRSESSPRTRTDVTQQIRQQPRERRQASQERRIETKERRSQPTPTPRRTETMAQVRRPASAKPTRRAESRPTQRAAAPRRAAPQRAAPQGAERKSAPAAQARQSSEPKSERRSERRRQ
ncbi:MAG: DUF3300 domain-containing protein, partial [Gammaproteobacteria bacterium]|nr:DUF3300 domain-containing protein [Gammaproteobacteria bacterium]